MLVVRPPEEEGIPQRAVPRNIRLGNRLLVIMEAAIRRAAVAAEGRCSTDASIRRVFRVGSAK